MRAQRRWLGFGGCDAYRGAAGGQRRLDRQRYGLEGKMHPGNVHAEAGVMRSEVEVFVVGSGTGRRWRLLWHALDQE
jgi:hypothetical protein